MFDYNLLKGIDVFVITNGNAFSQDRLQELASFSLQVLFRWEIQA